MTTYLDTKQACLVLGGRYTPNELARMAKAGRIPGAHKPEGTKYWLFDPSVLERWVKGEVEPERSGPMTSGKRGA